MNTALNAMDMTGKTVLVTGASSGIGRDTSIFLSQLGARVILVARNEEKLRQTLSQMDGKDHLIKPYDITRHEQTSSWMLDTASESGPIHGLVHSAGITHTEALRFFDLAKLEEILDINLKSSFSLASAFRQKRVRATPEARLIFISSVAAIRGYPGLSSYAASKGGVLAMTRPLAVELAREGINVNCVIPGYVVTEMTESAQSGLPPDQWEKLQARHPLGVGHPRDISQPIAFLLSSGARWITGQALIVDGGLSLA